jgi:hypothetical protein
MSTIWSKDEFRKQLTETISETTERLRKINAISDREERMKAHDDFMEWRICQHRLLLSEFKKWVWSE